MQSTLKTKKFITVSIKEEKEIQKCLDEAYEKHYKTEQKIPFSVIYDNEEQQYKVMQTNQIAFYQMHIICVAFSGITTYVYREIRK